MKMLFMGNGNSIHTQRWIDAYLKKGWNVELITTTIMPTNNFDNKIFQMKLPKLPIGYMSKYWKLGASYKTIIYAIPIMYHIKKFKPDIIIAHEIPTWGVFASMVKKMISNIPLITAGWGKIPDEFINHVIDESTIIHIGDKAAKQHLIDRGCPSEKILIQPWGVDTQRFSPESYSDVLRKKYATQDSDIIIIGVRSLTSNYHNENLIQSMPKLLEYTNNFKVIFVGDGPEKRNLLTLAKDLNVESHVIFTGTIPNKELHKYYAISNIYVDTFYIDKVGGGIGIAAMEAMSSELPIVAAERPGVEEGVTEGVNGLLYRGGDSGALADTLLKLMKNPELRKQYGQASRRLALEIGDWNKNVDEMDKIIKILIKQSGY